MRTICLFWAAVQICAMVAPRFGLALTQTERNFHEVLTTLTLLLIALSFMPLPRLQKPWQIKLVGWMKSFALAGIFLEITCIGSKAFLALWSQRILLSSCTLGTTAMLSRVNLVPRLFR